MGLTDRRPILTAAFTFHLVLMAHTRNNKHRHLPHTHHHIHIHVRESTQCRRHRHMLTPTFSQQCWSHRHDALPLVIGRFWLLRQAPGMALPWLFVARQHCLRSAGSSRLTCIAVLLTSSNGVRIRLQSTFAFVFLVNFCTVPPQRF